MEEELPAVGWRRAHWHHVVEQKPTNTATFGASAESRDRRRERYAQVIALRQAGATMQQIAARLHMSIGTVHGWLHADGFPERARQKRTADDVAAKIREQWTSGCRSASAIWRTLQADGFTGSKRTVQREVARLGLDHDAATSPPTQGGAAGVDALPNAVRPPSPRHIAWLFGRSEMAGTDCDREFIDALCARSHELRTVRTLALQFVQMVRTRDSAAYDGWLTAAGESELSGFARGLRSDDAAVRAALSTPWSNGPTEGQIHRLKLLKRMMYGRAKLDLLRLRVITAA